MITPTPIEDADVGECPSCGSEEWQVNFELAHTHVACRWCMTVFEVEGDYPSCEKD